MVESVDRYKALIDKLSAAGKITVLNRPQDLKAIEEMDKEMAKVKREYHIKNVNSKREAAKLTLR